MVRELPRLLPLLFVTLALLSGGCERSSQLGEVSADPDARAAALALIDKEIETSPKEGNLYLQRLALLLGEPEVSSESRHLWQQLSAVPGGKKALSNLVAHPNLSVRINAARLAATTGLREAIPELKKGAEVRDPQVRVVCLWGLRQLGDTSSYMLVALLLRDSISEVRGQAASTLQSYPCKDAAWRLLNLLEDPVEYVRFCAAASLVEIAGNPEVRSELKETLATDSGAPSRKEVSAIALAGQGEPEALAFVENNVRHPGLYRKFAAEALVRGNPERAMKLFGEILREGETDVDMKEYMSSQLASLRNSRRVQ